MRLVFDLQACQATNRARGIGRYALSLSQGMAELATANGRDHEVRIVLNNRFPETVEQVLHTFDGLVQKDRFHIFDVPHGIAAAHADGTWRAHAAQQIREGFIADLRPDVTHVASLFEGWVDDAATSIGRGPVSVGGSAVTLYDLIPLMRQEIYLSDARMRRWYFEKLDSLKRADLLLAISDYTRTEAISALQLPAEHVVNISSAIDGLFQPRQLSTDASLELRKRYNLTKPFLMYTGGIDPRKNIEGLIDAFARLPATITEGYQLAIVCNARDVDQQRLNSRAERAGLKRGTLVMTGFVPEEDLIDLYNSATAFVFPSLHEGFGLPVLEAMACGTPVIGSNSSSIPEVIGYSDALFDPTDINAMAAKISQVLTDEAFRTALREHALVQARRFSWKESARRALDGFEAVHERLNEASRAQVSVPAQTEATPSVRADVRPHLAYLSPLPPEKSGIADYSAELLRELVRYYDIDVIARSEVGDPWIHEHCRVRSIAWFEEHADDIDRIVYHIGNSEFHVHMFDLLKRFPGIVVLHDFFLSNVVNFIEDHCGVPHALNRALYASHGYAALIAQQREGRLASIWGYPSNRLVIDDATGVIVHSRLAKTLADQWYGPGVGGEWSVIPLIRTLPEGTRQAARERLGLSDSDFLTCSFGLLGKTKLNDRLLDAWLASPLASDSRCKLVFVGENDPTPYGTTLRKTIDSSGLGSRIQITGFASRELYRAYLMAADSAVQLRGLSRGETSAAILDCLAHGVPTVVNANGSAAELPDDTLLKMPDQFSQDELIECLARLRDTDVAQGLSARAVEYIRLVHDPVAVGKKYYDAIEECATVSRASVAHATLRSMSQIEGSAGASEQDLIDAVNCVVLNDTRASSPRQMFVDVSELVQRDAKSGIQRVVKNVLSELLCNVPEHYRVEPVYEHNGQYIYARSLTCKMLQLPLDALENEEIEVHPGDCFLGLDLYPAGVARNEQLYLRLRNIGVKMFFVVYDLLPVLRPDTFVEGAATGFSRWLDTITHVSDGVVCISRAVADELCEWMERSGRRRATPLRVDYFHLGANRALSCVSPERPAEKQSLSPSTTVLQQVNARPTFLMVGTVERRKAHTQVLAAMELLWDQGIDVNLLIVGRQGWLVEELVKQIDQHDENGKRLFWIKEASDSLLVELYQGVSALLVASEAEGFGLPLIEAAQYNLPIIARDIPVFREVAGEHAFYFAGTAADTLASRLNEWLKLLDEDAIPKSGAMPWLTWAESTQQLLAPIKREHSYRVVQ